MTLIQRLVSCVAATLLFAGSLSAAQVGASAPAFSLVDTQGNEHSLSDFEGKVVVLEWTNFGCPFVKKHYNSGNMQGLQEHATGKDVVWLSICSSAPGKQGNMSSEEWSSALEEKGSKATAVLIDESGEVGRAYGAKATPHMFVIDESGTLVYDGAIDSIASASPSDIEKAENYVKSALASLFAGEPIETAKAKPYGCGIKYAQN
ncbi:thioredoxin family protein [Pelagicoccus albus]|uniref:Thioredoxin family protein n=1 Tax=Pelagicoccus albus TaxID=415222 RepID=A0A7X1B578_9BACT|nr:thioredoxin family protein [Pelagicoccus albus]MBC2605847.1 thioredoxin family protein [Pelagicoccus albus]